LRWNPEYRYETVLFTQSIAAPVAMAKSQQTLYFGYGSNIWLHQMSLRCPTSKYIGVARLPNFRWIINSRGYANVVASASSDEVYGLVYSLAPSDEAQLDINESVPHAYTKETMKANLWVSKIGEPVDVAAGGTGKAAADLLVYIDRHRTADDAPKKEYIHRMNMGIKDALKRGVPEEYVDQVIRRFIPKQCEPGMEELANRQALRFEDER